MSTCELPSCSQGDSSVSIVSQRNQGAFVALDQVQYSSLRSFNNFPIDFKLTRTHFRTENFPCCARKGVSKTLPLSFSLSLLIFSSLLLIIKGSFLGEQRACRDSANWGKSFDAQINALGYSMVSPQQRGGRIEGDRDIVPHKWLFIVQAKFGNVQRWSRLARCGANGQAGNRKVHVPPTSCAVLHRQIVAH